MIRRETEISQLENEGKLDQQVTDQKLSIKHGPMVIRNYDDKKRTPHARQFDLNKLNCLTK